MEKKYPKKIYFRKFTKSLKPDRSTFKPKIKLFFLILFLLFSTIALVNPKVGTELKTVIREGVDIVFALDVSKSMLAEDIAPNRLEKAKRIVSELINTLNNDRVGIISYAASALKIIHINDDYSTAKTFLQSLNTEMLSSQGTAIIESINLSKKLFDNEDQTNKVLCILSDGEDHEIGNQNIIQLAQQSGITIMTVGLGTQKGSPIPIEKKYCKIHKKMKMEMLYRSNKDLLSSISSSSNRIM